MHGTMQTTRITPAHAGKRRAMACPLSFPEDHPRMCGEKSPLGPCGPVSPGSPPRMRGKGNLKIALVLGVGITPAHAGKRDSPRPDRPSAGGSPPHMRGKADHISGHNFGIGITPAHAGKSFPVKLVSRQLQDHPRTCGEKPFTAYLRAWWGGSPPHMRGKASGS